jgi:hypothetical protein
MTNLDAISREAKPKKGPRRENRHPISLPGGDMLVPRRDFAEKEIGVSERTLIRLNLPTVYIGGVAHVARDGSLAVIASGVQRRNQPPVRRRRP